MLAQLPQYEAMDTLDGVPAIRLSERDQRCAEFLSGIFEGLSVVPQRRALFIRQPCFLVGGGDVFPRRDLGQADRFQELNFAQFEHGRSVDDRGSSRAHA